MENKTKIIATIGPACSAKTTLKKMIKMGLDCGRFNFSHGTHPEHKELINNLKGVALEAGKIVTIIADLQGPRVRVGEMQEEEIKTGEMFAFGVFPKNAIKFFKPGQTLVIEDGKLECVVKMKKSNKLFCEFKNSGVLKPHKGINVRDFTISMPSITEKDKKDLEFIIKTNVDYVVASFVKNANDIKGLRRMIEKLYDKKTGSAKFGTKPGIIAKIETSDGVKNIKEIIIAADAIMIGRGDLALQVDMFDLPVIQKDIINICRKFAKPVIVATQMLESMIINPKPTRAEISDVGNAVFDGADAVMLSGETAGGKYPVEAIAIMAGIIRKSEASKYDNVAINKLPQDIGKKARMEAEKAKARAIVVVDDIDAIPLVSRARPGIPIYLHVTEREELLRQLNLFWGVFPNPKDEVKKKPIVYIEDGGVRSER